MIFFQPEIFNRSLKKRFSNAVADTELKKRLKSQKSIFFIIYKKNRLYYLFFLD